jgi:hypothetical protein
MKTLMFVAALSVLSGRDRYRQQESTCRDFHDTTLTRAGYGHVESAVTV